MTNNDRNTQVDLLVDDTGGQGLSLALSAEDFCLQWERVPSGTLRDMERMLSNPCGSSRELRVGEIFGVALELIEREGMFSFKAADEAGRSDLIRLDLPVAVVSGLVDALADAIENWEDVAGQEEGESV